MELKKNTDTIEIIYIHGFASSGNASKATLIKNTFSELHRVNSPTLSHHPEKALVRLNEIVHEVWQREAKILMIGSSLGGFYADYFNLKCGIPCVLINPLVDVNDLRPLIGNNKNLSTGETFFFSEADFNNLKKIQEEKLGMKYSSSKEIVLIANDDELLDPAKTKKYFAHPNQLIKISPGGGHRFENTEELIGSIGDALENLKALSE